MADELLVAPALARAVGDGGHGEEVPAVVVEELREWHRGNTVRNVRLRHQLIEAVLALNEAGIVPLLFKGALQLVDGTLAGVGDRWLTDLDLLIAREAAVEAGVVLEELGYQPTPGRAFLHPHELPFCRVGMPGPIELHVELGSEPIPSVLSAAKAWAESFELSVGGARARGLCPTHQVLHSVLHSSVQDLNHAVGGLPLRQLLSLAGLVRSHGPAVDWLLISRRMQAHGLARQLRDHLWLAHRFCGMALPEGDWDWRARRHELLVLASFALGWPAHLQRNLRFAFGAEYLDSLYGHHGRRLALGWARAVHGVRSARRGGREALRDALRLRI